MKGFLPDKDFDFRRLAIDLLSGYNAHNQPVRVAWMVSLLHPLRLLHDFFLRFYNAKKDEIKWNGQTAVLERLLQIRFGSAKIKIVNNRLDVDGAFVGMGADTDFYIGEDDDQSTFVAKFYTISDYNFLVMVPQGLEFDRSRMVATIDKYKLFGTNYNIQII